MLIKKNGCYIISGASSGIGLALVTEFLLNFEPQKLIATHRRSSPLDGLSELKKRFPGTLSLFTLDAENEEDYQLLAQEFDQLGLPVDGLINCIGVLNEKNDPKLPERKIEDFDVQSHMDIYRTNTLPTLLLAKHLKKLMTKSEKPFLISLSAKVGSITDNNLGGWYSYRISKAALNMAIKTLAVELQRINKKASVFAVHPGTTDTKMTQDFLPTAQKKYTIHTAEQTAQNICQLLIQLTQAEAHGCFLSYDGSQLPW